MALLCRGPAWALFTTPVPPILQATSLSLPPFLPAAWGTGLRQGLSWAPLVQPLGPSWLFVLEVAEAVLVSDWLVQ